MNNHFPNGYQEYAMLADLYSLILVPIINAMGSNNHACLETTSVAFAEK